MFVTKIHKQTGKAKLNHHGWIRTESTIKRMLTLGIEEVQIDEEKTFDANNNNTNEIVESEKIKPQEKSLSYQFDKSNLLYQEAKEFQKKMLKGIKVGKPLDTKQVTVLAESFVDSIFINSDALLCMTRIREKGAYLFEHSVNVSVIISVFAKYLKMDRAVICELATGAFLHDVGKIFVPSKVLNKPGKLTTEEYDIIKTHVKKGVTIVNNSNDFSRRSIELINQHHERLDGTGYPQQLSGDDINQFGRMIAIVDVYDALTAKRCYKDEILSTAAFNILIKESQTGLDQALVQHFIKSIGIHPVGTLILLKSSKLAFVLKSNSQQPLKPIVRVFYSTKSKVHIEIKDIELSASDCVESIVKAVDPGDYNIDMLESFRQVVLSQA